MKKIFTLITAVSVLFITVGCTEMQKRELKSFESNWNGGLNRTLTLYDYNGNVIKTWEGKFDIRDSGSDNQIFFDLDGKRIWIQGGIVVSEEK